MSPRWRCLLLIDTETKRVLSGENSFMFYLAFCFAKCQVAVGWLLASPSEIRVYFNFQLKRDVLKHGNYRDPRLLCAEEAITSDQLHRMKEFFRVFSPVRRMC